MARKAVEAKSRSVEGFPESPFPQAKAIEREEKERLRAKRLEQLKAREMSQPHLASHIPDRPDLLAIDPKAEANLKARGLRHGWIGPHEVSDYISRGYRLAAAEDVGQLRHDYQNDSAEPPTSVVTRRNDSVCVIAPESWWADRMKTEQFKDKIQLDADPFDDLDKQVRAGHFGKGNKRRVDALDIDDDEGGE